jgi:hypothetical protein
MRVLVACEFSGVVRRAFRALGHDAWSCDLLPAEDGAYEHFRCDVRAWLDPPDSWDLLIAHPPCQYLSVSGLHWNARIPGRLALHDAALAFVRELLDAPIPRICLENPVGAISTHIRKPDQIIQPYLFGHPESKQTCLWLKNLPHLAPTHVLEPTRFQANGRPRWDNQTPTGQNKLGPSPTRAADRARTYTGIAAAMAAQWGVL